MRKLWERLWFVQESAVNLAAARIIFSLHAIWVLLSHDIAAHSALPAEFWTTTRRIDSWRYLIFPGHVGLEHAIEYVTIALLFAAAIGLAPRLSCFFSGLLLFHLAPLETLFWSPNPYERGLTIDLLVLLTLAVAPCGDALSLTKPRRTSPDDYGWSLRLVQFHLATIYLLAGLSKLRRVGFHWIDAENQRRWLLVFNQEPQVHVFRSAGPFIASHPTLCWTMGITALLLDLGFVVAVFSKRSRWVIVPLAAAGHLGILFAMNIFFINLPQLLVFVDWHRMRRKKVVRGDA